MKGKRTLAELNCHRRNAWLCPLCHEWFLRWTAMRHLVAVHDILRPSDPSLLKAKQNGERTPRW
jgi:hypothetical protein